MAAPQRPLELILARNLLTSLSTPGFLIDGAGVIVFYNEAAAGLLGRPFEPGKRLTAGEWSEMFGPYDDAGAPVNWEELALTQALRGDRPAHSAFCIRSLDGTEHPIEASGLPIVGADGFHGALVFFWEAGS